MMRQMYRPTKRLVKLSSVVVVVCTIIGAAPVVGAVGETASTAPSRNDTPSPDVTVRPSEETKKARHEVDVLTASRAEIGRKLAALNQSYGEQQAVLAAAREAVVSAEADVEAAKKRVADAQDQAESARQAARGYAVEAYMNPPSHAAIGVLAIADTQDAGFANDVLTIMADERQKVVDEFEVKKKIAAMEQDQADKAVAEAQQRSAEADQELERLADLRAEQAGFVAAMDDRLGNALAEAAALEAIDEQAAKELAQQEMDLRSSADTSQLAVAAPGSTSRLVSAPAGAGGSVATTPPSSTRGTSPTTTRPVTPTTRPVTTTTRPPSPTTTTKPPAPPSGVVTWNDVVNVGGGIWIHRSIEAKTRSLLTAATAAGFSLTGGGYRDSASQIATRMANCGTTYYDIYEKPSGQCRPPTAIPGRSMHERGLAMDLKSNGALITSRSNPAFIWLSNNAARYGFYNLPSEPWHWSTTGH